MSDMGQRLKDALDSLEAPEAVVVELKARAQLFILEKNARIRELEAALAESLARVEELEKELDAAERYRRDSGSL